MLYFFKQLMVRAMLIAVLITIGLQGNAQTESRITRYNYFFLEAIRQQEMGNLAAAFDCLIMLVILIRRLLRYIMR